MAAYYSEIVSNNTARIQALEEEIEQINRQLFDMLPFKRLTLKEVCRERYNTNYDSRSASMSRREELKKIVDDRKRANQEFRKTNPAYHTTELSKNRRQREVLKLKKRVEEAQASLNNLSGTPIITEADYSNYDTDEEVQVIGEAVQSMDISTPRHVPKRAKIELKDEACADTEKMCITCSDNKAIVRVDDCGHCVLCIECMRALRNSSSNWANKCPVCRRVMTTYSILAQF